MRSARDLREWFRYLYESESGSASV
ncbi:MAG: hypothetical protein RLZZ194_614, partial [Actinomycetota bacterium]